MAENEEFATAEAELDSKADAPAPKMFRKRWMSPERYKHVTDLKTREELRRLDELIAGNPALANNCVRYKKRKDGFEQRQSLFSLLFTEVLLTVAVSSFAFISEETSRSLILEFYSIRALPTSLVALYTFITAQPGCFVVPGLAVVTALLWLCATKLQPRANHLLLYGPIEVLNAVLHIWVPVLLTFVLASIVVIANLYARTEGPDADSIARCMYAARGFSLIDALVTGPTLVVLYLVRAIGVKTLCVPVHIVALMVVFHTLNIVRGAVMNLGDRSHAIAVALFAAMSGAIVWNYRGVGVLERNMLWMQLFAVGIFAVQGIVLFIEIMLRPEPPVAEDAELEPVPDDDHEN